MTKQLSDLLNLPDDDEKKNTNDARAEISEEEHQKNEEERKDMLERLAKSNELSLEFRATSGLGKLADNELNDIAKKAVDAYEDLMDLGMNVEQRYSGRLFEVAGSMLKTGLDAKVAKIDKKLKLAELQLKKERLEIERMKAEQKQKQQSVQIKTVKDDNEETSDEPIEGESSVVADRNTLLQQLQALQKGNKGN